MKQCISILVLFSIIFTGQLHAQKVIISGTSASYAGDSLFVVTCGDPVTHAETTLAACKADKNGKFGFAFTIREEMPVYMHLGVSKGLLFIEPGKQYEIKLPEKEQKTLADILNPYFEESEFYIGIVDITPEDLHYNIIKFDDMYNTYLDKHFLDLVKKSYNSNIDTFISATENRFSNYKNPYFDNYKYYQFAYLRHIAFERNDKHVFEKYFANKPILYSNLAYTFLFNQIFNEYFLELSKTHNSLQFLNEIVIFLNKEEYPGNPAQKELILLKGLFDSYYSKQFQTKEIIVLIDSIQKNTKLARHKNIAKNSLAQITRLMENYPAPAFECYDENNNPVTLNHYRGKYVYLDFGTIKSYACLREMELLKGIYEKSNKELEIVTISVDDDFSETMKYAREKSYNWTFLHYRNNHELLRQYNVRVYPTYYLIDPDGKLITNTTPAPQENFDVFFHEIWNKRRIEQIRNGKNGQNDKKNR